MKPFIKISLFGRNFQISRIISFTCEYAYDDEDSVGFFNVSTITGKTITCQIRNGNPMFVELRGFGNTRYDIAYPDLVHPEFYKMLKVLCNQTERNFWKGGHI